MRLLRELGYEDVREYAGGLADWLEQGEAAESSARRRRVRSGAGRLQELRASTPARHGSGGNGRRRRAGIADRLIDSLVLNRSIAELLGIWMAVVMGFGVLYWAAAAAGLVWLQGPGGPLGTGLGGLATALYFSFVTALSIGYGDFSPLGPARALAVLEGASGLMIFGCVVSKLVSRRQEELVEDTHWIAFEQRLGRVRTSLHLVLSELVAIAKACADGSAQGERVRIRAESTMAVFEGELVAVHDLLYRPEQLPDEQVLEAILANLAACLEVLAELLSCMPAETRRSARLGRSLAQINAKAVQICADCVPRPYAADLGAWMDRVQELAQRVAMVPE